MPTVTTPDVGEKWSQWKRCLSAIADRKLDMLIISVLGADMNQARAVAKLIQDLIQDITDEMGREGHAIPGSTLRSLEANLGAASMMVSIPGLSDGEPTVAFRPRQR